MPVTQVEYSHTGPALTVRQYIYDEIAHIRRFNSHAGEYERLVDADGGWTTVDTSLNGTNTYDIVPPDSLRPQLKAGQYHVRRYEEDAVSADGRLIDATVALVRTEPRSKDGSLPSQSAGSDEWQFGFANGTIAVAEVRRADQGDQEDIELEMTLTPTQAEVILEDPTRLDAVSVQEVPDGDDFVRDADPNDRNTVTITRPSSADSDFLPDSGKDYAVRDWSLTVNRADRYDATMTVRKLP